MAGIPAESVVYLEAQGRALLLAAWRAAALLGARGREPCGYLLGRQDADDCLRVASVLRGENVHPLPAQAWALAPKAQLQVRRAAREQGQRVIGYWHGHLIGPARPGRRDHADRDPLSPGLHLIVGRRPGAQPEIRAWRAGRTGFAPLVVSVSASPPGPS